MSEPVDENEFYKQYRFGGYVVDDEVILLFQQWIQILIKNQILLTSLM